MASEGGCKKTAAIFEDDDYLTLDRLLLSLTKDVTFSDGSFTLCMWIYLVKSSKGNIIITQVQGSGEAAFPFLTLECERKLSLFPAMLFKLDIDGALDASIDKLSVTAELPCSLDKWVHVGCEEIKSVELVEPTGWTYISLCPSESREAFVQTFMLQLAILANHQNGRDTHIRQVKVYGPYPWATILAEMDFILIDLAFKLSPNALVYLIYSLPWVHSVDGLYVPCRGCNASTSVAGRFILSSILTAFSFFNITGYNAHG